MHTVARKPAAALLIGTLALTASAQQTPTRTKQVAAAKAHADRLAPQAKISVVRVQADEEFGRFLTNTPDSFTFYDVDEKRNVTLAYTDVRKIKDGYGGYNFLRQRHTDRTKGLIVTALVLGVLGGLTIAVATAKN